MSYESEAVKQGFTGALFDAIERGLGERTIEVFSSAERQKAFFENALDAGPYRAGVEVFLHPILSDCGILDATIQSIASDAASLLHQAMCRMAAYLSQLGFDPFEDRFEWSASTYFGEMASIVGADAPYSINDYVKIFDRACAWIKAERVRQRLTKQPRAPTDQGPIGLRVTHPGFTKDDLRRKTGLSNEALRKAMILCNIPRAGKGKKNHRYPLDASVKLLEHIRDNAQHIETKQAANGALEDIAKSHLNPIIPS